MPGRSVGTLMRLSTSFLNLKSPIRLLGLDVITSSWVKSRQCTASARRKESPPIDEKNGRQNTGNGRARLEREGLESASDREVYAVDILVWFSVEWITNVKTYRSDWGDVLKPEAGT